MPYRLANSEDKDQLVQLIINYCEEINQTSNKESIEKSVEFQLKYSVVYVADNEKDILGVLSFVIINNPFNDKEKIGRKTNCYVRPEYRNQGMATDLIELSERYCKSEGCTKFFFSGRSNPGGYKQFEIDYVKELN